MNIVMGRDQKLRFLETLSGGIRFYIEFYQTRETEQDKKNALRLLQEAIEEAERFAIDHDIYLVNS